MGRPRKYGPTISFRLPVELHAVAAERAARYGMTVDKYLAGRIIEALDRPPSPAPPLTGTARPRKVTPQWKASMKP